jgi:ABC-type sugar transport system ATPase subunit
MAEPSFEVEGLSFHRASARLGPITFSLPHPGCWWLAGPSGAGKSLLLESLAGFHAEAQGGIRVDGKDIADQSPEHRDIALMPQRWRLFPHWTVARNLQFAAKLGKNPSARIEALAERLQITPLLNRSIRALSGGETQRIALIQTLLAPATVLLLDEPLSAIDAALQSVVLDLLQEQARTTERTCLIAAHKPTPGYPMQGALHIEGGQLLSSPKTA